MAFSVSLFFLLSLFLFTHSQPTYQRDAFLRISCRKTLFATLSPECKRFLARTRATTTPFISSPPTASTTPASSLAQAPALTCTSVPPTTPTTRSSSSSASVSSPSSFTLPTPSNDTIARIHTIQKQTHTLATTTRALTSSLASLASIYLAVVAFLKVRRGFSLRRSFSLGLLGRTQSEGIGAGSIPLRVAGPSPMVSTI